MDNDNLGDFSRCKTCTCKYSKEVNQKLLNGESQRSVVKWLEKKGIKISQASIGRHYNNHLQKNTQNAGYEKGVEYASNVRSKHPNCKTNQPATPETTNPETQIILTEPEKIYEQMKNEFDAFNEMLKTIAIQKARLNAGLVEEGKAQMLLNTVDRSIQTYSALIIKFKEMMSGAESLERLRYVQLQNLIAEIFASGD